MWHSPRAREGHVVLAELGSHGRAGDAYEHRADSGREGDRGQGEVPQGIGEAAAFAEDGEPAEHETEDVQEYKAEGEAGRGHAHNRPADDRAINPGSPAPCRSDPEGDADCDGEDKCTDGEPGGQ